MRETETKLRSLAAEAVGQGRYEDAMQLTLWGRALARLCSEGSNASATAEQGTMTRSPGAGTTGAQSAAATEKKGGGRRSAKRTKKQRKRGRTTRSAQYPRFFRRAKNLVKVGWSKSARKEYSHRVGRALVDMVASVLAKLGTSDELFTANDFMPILNPQDGTEIPSYQAYLCLAWFRKEGLVTQHGRQGYTIPEANSLTSKVAERWDALPRK